MQISATCNEMPNCQQDKEPGTSWNSTGVFFFGFIEQNLEVYNHYMKLKLHSGSMKCRPGHSWDDNEPQKLEVLDYDASPYGKHQFINCFDANEYLIPS